VHRAAIINLNFVQRIVRERPGRCVVELKHGLGQVEVSRAGAEALRAL
jgi:DNA-binding LytR/AlgR family response regulator